jgi:acyl-CoA synthetase (AMP-forming)/AMP-acid ligase II
MKFAKPPIVKDFLRKKYEDLGYWSRPPLASHVEDHASKHPSRLAVTDGSGNQLTYLEFNNAVIAATNWFKSKGLSVGDSAVFALRNEIDYALAHVAASRMGLVSVMLSAREGKNDIFYAQQKTGAKLILISSGKNVKGIQELIETSNKNIDENILVVEVDADNSELSSSSESGSENWPGWRIFMKQGANIATDMSPIHIPKPDDFELVVFSSGTTGEPKGIAHTYNGTGASLYNWINELELTSEDAVFCPATLGHVGGAQWGLRTAMIIGAPLVLMDKWDVSFAAKQIFKFKCRYTLLTPTFLVDLMNLPDQERELLASFRLWTVGGSGMSSEFIIRSESKLPGIVLRGFGMSEHFMSTITRVNDPIEKRRNNDGRLLPGCEVEVWDDNQEKLPLGQPGEMAVRGPSAVGGYFTHPDETVRSYVGGWQLTGDIITLDSEGFIKVVDRKKEIIIRGGENIAPQEIEQIIMRNPKIPPFIIVGVPDERLGERVGMVFEGPSTNCSFEQILEILASAEVAKYKWPEVLMSVTELPRTSLGKIRRGVVRNAVRTDFKEENLELLSKELR